MYQSEMFIATPRNPEPVKIDPVLLDVFGSPISCYSRAQAIEDGELVDVTERAREAGFRLPVALTRAVFGWVEPSEHDVKAGQDLQGRLWDTLWMAYLAVRGADAFRTRIGFAVLFRMHGRMKKAQFVIAVGPGDEGEPVFTIMERGED